jgi:hypothetical protein
LALWVVLLFGVYSHGRENYVFCWDSLRVDGEIMVSLSNMAEDEYLASGDLSRCPEGYDAIQMTGRCEPE